MKRILKNAVRLMIITTIAGANAQNTPQEKLTVNDQKINAIIAQMTLEEKVEMLHSKTIMSSEGVPRLGIQDIKYADGPFAVREEIGDGFQPLNWTTDSATYYPTGSALAATWSYDLAYDYGKALGTEARRRGKDIILGPAMNIQRLPVGGRTYEYFSEDPALNTVLAVGYTKGMQDAGTAACLKHYALNNQETNRGSVDVIIAERPMREIYLKAFEAAVKEGGAMCVMPAYNKVNGYYGSENNHLNNVILRGEWGFKGMTVSDWGGTHSTMGAALGGLNVQMTGDNFFGPPLIEAVREGKLNESVIDDKVREILRLRFAVEAIPNEKANTVKISQKEQQEVAYNVATKAIVLLKNEKTVLPINPSKTKKIAVIGLNATAPTAWGGMGAGAKTPYEITPLQGLQNRLGDQVEIQYAQAYKNFLGMFAAYRPNDPTLAQTLDEAPDATLLAEALSVARNADLVLFFAGTNKFIESEGVDRENITLPVSQDLIIAKLAEVNPNIVTVVVSGGPCDLRVVEEKSKAIVQAWWNGLEGGHALADVLLGTIAPSGKLPFTFPLKLEDSPAYALNNFSSEVVSDGDVFAAQFRHDIVGDAEYDPNIHSPKAYYSEGSLVGYRWFDTKGVPVLYPFGHGLSYVDFNYANIRSDKKQYAADDIIKVSFDLTNQGTMAADEVVQLYVRRLDAQVEWPNKELKTFERVTLAAGQTRTVTLEVPVAELRYWDESTNGWQLENGQLEVLVGRSSADMPLKMTVGI
ncbi:glycoside hydrolase family 3 C-terminal domain-containing protein [Parabacteroides sp. PF5-6]|uniref:glycoside hydrolase family 3 C-terminal domain-containing protein n=1 Tax=Parabacteroides sp. PF5-6 TaxID=1742403 RepID=UPI00240690F1|nr:glycoside hydrolase family 3 C-terminal domain-containing protein [Parabacteroides sp. PF5-6]MDF9829689.1 beta-glucosidase [Parabacteroides sp. PF5-6]